MKTEERCYVCSCGRMQTKTVKGLSGGVSESVAELIGWRKINGLWVCPFCSGNIENLKRVFGVEE